MNQILTLPPIPGISFPHRVRGNSKHQIDALKSELIQRENYSTVMKEQLEKIFKEKDLLERKTKDVDKVWQDKEKVYLDKIESLNQKCSELSKRAQTLSANHLKKKVENAVFQESADLRAKLQELTSDNKKLELEKWTLDKKLNGEKTTSKQKLLGELIGNNKNY